MFVFCYCFVCFIFVLFIYLFIYYYYFLFYFYFLFFIFIFSFVLLLVCARVMSNFHSNVHRYIYTFRLSKTYTNIGMTNARKARPRKLPKRNTSGDSGETRRSSFCRVLACPSGWETCGDSRTWPTKMAVVGNILLGNLRPILNTLLIHTVKTH